MLRSFVAATLVAMNVVAAQQDGATQTVAVRGTVFDSLTGAPLAAARVEFVPEATPGAGARSVVTTAAGAFEIALPSGRWLAAIEHPRFDSLQVTIPPRHVEIPRSSRFNLVLATPSARTLTRAFCGLNANATDIALVGLVHGAGTILGLDSVRVLVQWTELTVGRGQVRRTQPVHVVRTDGNGWYVMCGVPRWSEVVAWAERGGAATGAILEELSDVPTRLDLSLDAAAAAVGAVRDSAASRVGGLLGPAARAGSVRYRAIVRDLTGRPVPNAKVRVLGHPFAISDEHGVVVLDSLAGGSQTLEVLAVGFAPERRTVDVGGGAEADTVVVASLKSVLDTIRITGGQDKTGFDMRRRHGVGDFMTAAEIMREDPRNTTTLLRGRPDGFQYRPAPGSFGRMGGLQMTRGTFKSCTPSYWLDGFPMPPMELNWAVHPEEIGALEIYDVAAKVPPQFINDTSGGRKGPCGAIVIWTRDKMHLPRVQASDRP